MDQTSLTFKAAENLIYSKLAFDKCRLEVQEYENARQMNVAGKPDPAKSAQQALNLTECQNNCSYIQPICQETFNEARECLFKSENQVNACRNILDELKFCQNNPDQYPAYLTASTHQQKNVRGYDFDNYRGHYSK